MIDYVTFRTSFVSNMLRILDCSLTLFIYLIINSELVNHDIVAKKPILIFAGEFKTPARVEVIRRESGQMARNIGMPTGLVTHAHSPCDAIVVNKIFSGLEFSAFYALARWTQASRCFRRVSARTGEAKRRMRRMARLRIA